MPQSPPPAASPPLAAGVMPTWAPQPQTRWPSAALRSQQVSPVWHCRPQWSATDGFTACDVVSAPRCRGFRKGCPQGAPSRQPVPERHRLVHQSRLSASTTLLPPIAHSPARAPAGKGSWKRYLAGAAPNTAQAVYNVGESPAFHLHPSCMADLLGCFCSNCTHSMTAAAKPQRNGALAASLTALGAYRLLCVPTKPLSP